jgi:hypothetical protein
LESVPEQSWSSTAFISTALRGLFGLEVNAEKSALTLTPHLPTDWDHASLRRVRMGNATLDFSFHQTINALTLSVENSGGPVRVLYRPEIPLGARAVRATVGGRKSAVRVETNAEDQHAVLDFSAPHGESEITIRYRDGIGIVMPASKPSLGQPSSGMKLTSVALEGTTLKLGVDEEPRRDNEFEIQTERSIRSSGHVRVQRLGPNRYSLRVEPSGTTDGDRYEHQEVTITFSE